MLFLICRECAGIKEQRKRGTVALPTHLAFPSPAFPSDSLDEQYMGLRSPFDIASDLRSKLPVPHYSANSNSSQLGQFQQEDVSLKRKQLHTRTSDWCLGERASLAWLASANCC